MTRHEIESNNNLFLGLDEARGDRLVDVIDLWGYRIENVYQSKEYDKVISYSTNVIPILIRKIKDKNTDIGLRATMAETLTSFGYVLDELGYRHIDFEEIDSVRKLRRGVIKGFDFCLELPTAIFGVAAITESLNKLTPTEDVIILRQKLAARQITSK